jgi:hypothetical protein
MGGARGRRGNKEEIKGGKKMIPHEIKREV